MTKTTLSFLACLALAPVAFAGPAAKETKEYVAPVPEPCFRDQEFQLDVFGSWTESDHNNVHRSGWGGGLGLNYFFMKNIGVGVDGNVYDGIRNVDPGEVVWDVTGRVIARFPIEGSVCWAPYVFAGGGILFDSTTVGTWHAGGGVEVRVTHTFGVFAEGRYSWGATEFDAAQFRAGFRFVF